MANESKNSNSLINLTELAKRSEVGIETVRYYQRKKLLRMPTSKAKERNRYDESDVDRVKFIRRTQALNFTLKEIQKLLELRDDPDGSRSEVRKIVATKVDEIEQTINRLIENKAKLNDLKGLCDGEDRIDCCPILMALDGKS